MKLVKACGIGCLVLVVFLAGTRIGRVQAQGILKPKNVIVLSGSDIGFRVEGIKETSVTGRFVIRISGKWVDIDNAFAAAPASEGR